MRRPAKILLTSALLLLCCLPAPVQADIYKYTDADGVIHFTNVSGGGRRQKKVVSETPARRTPAASRQEKQRPASAVCNIPGTYLEMIDNACARHGVDASLVHALVKVESDFNPLAISSRGAMGLMQLMPETAMIMNVKDSFDPAENIDGGVKYLRYLIDRYEGNLSLALAAYNSGETAVKKWGTIPPFKETQDYVKRILRIYNGGTGASPQNYVKRYTIYMGFGSDGSVVLTDNPTSEQVRHYNRKTGRRNL